MFNKHCGTCLLWGFLSLCVPFCPLITRAHLGQIWEKIKLNPSLEVILPQLTVTKLRAIKLSGKIERDHDSEGLETRVALGDSGGCFVGAAIYRRNVPAYRCIPEYHYALCLPAKNQVFL